MKNGFHEMMDSIPVPNQDKLKEYLIAQGKAIMKQKKQHISYATFVIMQFHFLKPGTWLLQGSILLLGGLLGIHLLKDGQISVLHFMFGIVPIGIHMLHIPRLLCSLEHEVWDLENTMYYRYWQVLMARFCLLGIGDLSLVVCFCALGSGVFALSFFQLLIDALIPYNLVNAFAMIILRYVSNDQALYCCLSANVVTSILLFFWNQSSWGEWMNSQIIPILLLFCSLLFVAIATGQLVSVIKEVDHEGRRNLWN